MKKNSIKKVFFITIIVIVIVYVIALGSILIWQQYLGFIEESNQERNYYIQSQKDIIKNEVIGIIDYIEYTKSLISQKLETSIKNRVYEAHSIVMNIYNEYKDEKSIDEIKKIIKSVLRPIRFNDGRGYYFIVSLDGIEELYPTNPEYEGKNLLLLQDVKGNYVIQEEINVAKSEEGEGFLELYWIKPGLSQEMIYPKRTFVKIIEPLDWLIGTGEYMDDVEKDVKKQVLERILHTSFGEDNYIFVLQFDGTLLSHSVKDYIGKNKIKLIGDNKAKLALKLLELAKKENGGYLEYLWDKYSNGEKVPKISYVKGIMDWEWIIGTGTYVDDIEYLIEGHRETLVTGFINQIILISLTILFLIIITIGITKLITKKMGANFNIFFSFFENASQKLLQIDTKNVYYSEFETLAQSANKMINDINQTENALRKSEEKIKVSLEEKEILLKEIHHRVKNNFQIVVSLINLQSGIIKNKNTLQFLKELQNRITSMAMVHEQLYKSKNFSNINFSEYIEDLINDLFLNYSINRNLVKLKTEIDKDITLDMSIAMSCGLIINELISNSLKHAFPKSTFNGKGIISVKFKAKDINKYNLIIADNGVGIPDNIDIEKTNSLGLNLVKLLTNQISGTLNVNRKNGTVFDISFGA